MAADPEFPVGQIFVADTGDVVLVLIDDRGELLHFEALGIILFNLLDPGNRLFQVIQIGRNK